MRRSTPSPASVEDALTGATWTQGAEEVDQLVGRLTIAVPNRGECSGGEGAPALPLEWMSPGVSCDWSLEPGTARSRVPTVQASDTCGSGGGAGSRHFTIDSISVDAIGAR